MNLRQLLFLKASGGKATENTATGNPLTFTTNIAKPLKSLLIPWTPTQAGSGDPSPENVRSISGITGLTVSNSGADTSNPTTYPVTFPALGKNLFDKNGSNILNAYLRTDDVASLATGKTVYIKCKPNTTYTVSKTAGQRFVVAYTKEIPANLVPIYGRVNDFTASSITITTGTDAEYLVAFVYNSSVDTGTAEEMLASVQIEEGSPATAYEPYTNTVYGGTLDITSGVLTAEWGSLTKTWGDFGNKTLLGDNTRGVYSISSFPSLGTGAGAMCNIAPRKLEWSQDVVHFYTNEASCIVILPNETADSTEIQVVYPVATPYEIQLTPQQITALVGDNVIWTDTNGTNTAVYLKRG